MTTESRGSALSRTSGIRMRACATLYRFMDLYIVVLGRRPEGLRPRRPVSGGQLGLGLAGLRATAAALEEAHVRAKRVAHARGRRAPHAGLPAGRRAGRQTGRAVQVTDDRESAVP